MDWEQLLTGAAGFGNSLLFGAPETIARKISGDNAIDKIVNKNKKAYEWGKVAGDVASATIPIGAIGKALKPGVKAIEFAEKAGDIAKGSEVLRASNILEPAAKAASVAQKGERAKQIESLIGDMKKEVAIKPKGIQKTQSPEEIKKLYNDVDDTRLSKNIMANPIPKNRPGTINEYEGDIIFHGSDKHVGPAEFKNLKDRALSATQDKNVLSRYGTSEIYPFKIKEKNRILDLSNPQDREKLSEIIKEHGDSVGDNQELADSLINHNLESDYQIGEAYCRDNRLLNGLRYSGYAGAKDRFGNYDIWDISSLEPIKGIGRI